MFDNLLNPTANKGREVPSDSALTAEAILVLLAGMDATANALTVATWALLRNNEMRKKLSRELRQAFPYPHATMTADTLQSLPYLVSTSPPLHSIPPPIVGSTPEPLAHQNPSLTSLTLLKERYTKRKPPPVLRRPGASPPRRPSLRRHIPRPENPSRRNRLP